MKTQIYSKTKQNQRNLRKQNEINRARKIENEDFWLSVYIAIAFIFLLLLLYSQVEFKYITKGIDDESKHLSDKTEYAHLIKEITD